MYSLFLCFIYRSRLHRVINDEPQIQKWPPTTTETHLKTKKIKSDLIPENFYIYIYISKILFQKQAQKRLKNNQGSYKQPGQNRN